MPPLEGPDAGVMPEMNGGGVLVGVGVGVPVGGGDPVGVRLGVGDPVGV